MAEANSPPQILVTVETSSPTLFRCGDPPFTITLKATMNGSEPVTINAFRTILLPRMPTLDYQGLTFTNTRTGVPAERTVIDIHYVVPDYLTSTTTSVIEIPPKHSPDPYVVKHTFHAPQLRQPATGEKPLSHEDYMLFSVSQVSGFEAGQSYEIGLGKDMSRILWWRRGKKNAVFAGEQRISSAADFGSELQMARTNTASFSVV